MRQGHILTRIIFILFGVFLVGYIGVQVWRSFYSPVQTVSAVYMEAEDSISLDGLIVREEKVLSTSDSGALEMVLSEGERAAKGDTVAAVYNDEQALEASRKLKDVDERISQMQTIMNQGNEIVDLDSMDEAIVEHTENILRMVDLGDFTSLQSEVSKLKNKTLSREYVYRDKSGLSDVLTQLNEERKQYVSAANAVKKRITAPMAGYFSHETDGYENVLSREILEEMTVGQFDEILQKHTVESNDAGTLGKIIGDYAWDYAALVDEKEAERFVLDEEVVLKFENPLYPQVPATVKRVSEAENGKVLVVLECNEHISDFTLARRLPCQVVLKTYQGLKVPREALRVNENGESGVYCMIDSQVRFKKVETIFEKDSYYIAKYDSADTKSLMLYDEIIVSAKDLEDRKVIGT